VARLRLPRSSSRSWTAFSVGSQRSATQTGRPLGGKAFIEELERRSGRALKPRKRGPKPKKADKDPTPDLFEAIWYGRVS
jgi:hypothetical protein